MINIISIINYDYKCDDHIDGACKNGYGSKTSILVVLLTTGIVTLIVIRAMVMIMVIRVIILMLIARIVMVVTLSTMLR